MPPGSFAQLRDCFADLYPQEQDAIRVVADAGINSKSINFSGSGQNRWHNILTEAEKLDAVGRLLAIMRDEYGGTERVRKLCIELQKEYEFQMIQTAISFLPMNLPLSQNIQAHTNPPYPNKIFWTHRIALIVLFVLILVLNFQDVQTVTGKALQFIMITVNRNTGEINPVRQIDGPIVFSNDNKKFATHTLDGTVILREMDSEKEIHRAVYQESIDYLIFSPDSTRLLIIIGKTVHIWDCTSGKEISALENEYAITEANMNQNGTLLVTSDRAGTIRLWNTTLGREIITRLPVLQANNTKFSPDGVQLAGIDAEGTLYVADSASRLQHTIYASTRGIKTFEYSPDGKRLAAINRNGSLFLWGSDGNGLINSSSTAIVEKFYFSANSQRLATLESIGANVSTIRLWDGKTGAQMASFSYQQQITELQFSPDSMYLGVASNGNNIKNEADTVYLINARLGTAVAKIIPTGPIKEIQFSPDSQTLVTATTSGVVSIWNNQNGTEKLRLTHNASLTALYFDSHTTQLATVTNNGAENNIHIWDTTMGRELQQISVPYEIEEIRFTTDSYKIIGIDKGSKGIATTGIPTH